MFGYASDEGQNLSGWEEVERDVEFLLRPTLLENAVQEKVSVSTPNVNEKGNTTNGHRVVAPLASSLRSKSQGGAQKLAGAVQGVRIG